MVLHTDFNQGIQLNLTDGVVITIQASVEKGKMRYWVGKPDTISVQPVQCRTSTKVVTR
jgi:translation initiation factor IF-1